MILQIMSFVLNQGEFEIERRGKPKLRWHDELDEDVA